MREKIMDVLGAVAILLLARNLVLIAGFPPDRAQGMIFKIIFFHVPAAMTALLGATVALIASVLFLATKNFKYDALAVAVTEVGLAFLAANLVTGSIWGRDIWGIWWTWDARLTSALVCWLLYAGYLMLRRAIEERTQRPQPVFWGGGTIPGDWYLTALLNLAAMLLLAFVLCAIRLRQEETQR